MLRFLAPSLLIAAQAFAPLARAEGDSLAVIHRPHTVLVQVNEKGANSRLQNLFDHAGAKAELKLENTEKTFRLRCARNEEAATCTARFNEGPGTMIFPRGAEASAELAATTPDSLELLFASSNGDKLSIEAKGGRISLRAEKR
ncbi:MAG: hypothetical protein EOP11_06595 [Proteobacteria bacterium]|nr:MAG: hypothetical protein EOP11_06595 [Pseudomonadota bacterium]